jgi:hypothetical protein
VLAVEVRRGAVDDGEVVDVGDAGSVRVRLTVTR